MLLVSAVELADEIEPVPLAAGNLIEVLFHLGGELDVDEIAEVTAQQARDRKRRETGHERLALPEDVAAALDGPDRRRVGRRAADAEPLELLDERGFGEPRRAARCRGASVRAPPRARAPPAPAPTRSPTVSFGSTVSCSSSSAAGSSLPSTYARRKPANSMALPDAVKIAGLAVGTGAGNLDRGAQHACVHHLRRHRALPDQLVDPQIAAVERAPRARRAWPRNSTAGSLRAPPARSSLSSRSGGARRSRRRRTSPESPTADSASAFSLSVVESVR